MAIYERIRHRLGAGFLIALLGNRGTGKTQIATKLIRYNCFARKVGSRWIKVAKLFDELAGAYDQNMRPSDVMQQYMFPFLVIDELHVRGNTPFEDRALTDFVDDRYNARLDTLLISNSTEPQFKESIGFSIIDRLIETGGVILCEWPSLREQNRANS